MYIVDGDLNMSTCEAQWLDNQLISECRGTKLLLEWDFPLR